jgi:hypothetical protein
MPPLLHGHPPMLLQQATRHARSQLDACQACADSVHPHMATPRCKILPMRANPAWGDDMGPHPSECRSGHGVRSRHGHLAPHAGRWHRYGRGWHRYGRRCMAPLCQPVLCQPGMSCAPGSSAAHFHRSGQLLTAHYVLSTLLTKALFGRLAAWSRHNRR